MPSPPTSRSTRGAPPTPASWRERAVEAATATDAAGRRVRGARGARPGRRRDRSRDEHPVVPAGGGPGRRPRPGRVGAAGTPRAGAPARGATATRSRSARSRDLAARTGALVTQAVMDLSLADLALAGFDREAACAARHGVRRGQPPLRPGHRARRPPVARRRPRPRGRRRGDGGVARATRWPATRTIRGSSATCTAACSRRARSWPTTSSRSASHLDTMMRVRRPGASRHLDLPRPRAVGDPPRDATTTTSARPPWRAASSGPTRMGMPTDRRSPPVGVEAVVRGRRGDHEAAAELVERGARHARRDRHRRRACGTPSRSWCRWRPSATAGAIRRPGCASRRRSSRPAATSAPPGGAEP